MAPSHVPAEQLPLQGQSMYNTSPYQTIYSVDQYDAQSWNNQLQHAALVSDNPATPSWHHNSYPSQQYNQISSPYVNQGQTHRTASPYQYGQFGNPTPPPSYGHAASVDPTLSVNQNAMRQQQHSPYPLAAQTAQPQSRPNTVTPQSLQHGLSLPVQESRATTSYQVSQYYIFSRTLIDMFTRSRSQLQSHLCRGLYNQPSLNLFLSRIMRFQRVKHRGGSMSSTRPL